MNKGWSKTVYLGIAVVLMLPFAISGTAHAGLNDGLVGYWTFDEGVGVIANDVSGNGNTGVINGATYVPGHSNTALSFDGINEVAVPDAPSLNLQAFTISAWVYPTSLDGRTDMIINKETNALPIPVIQYELAIRGPGAPGQGTIPVGNLAFVFGGGAGGIIGLPNDYSGWVDGYAPIPLNTWTHVALTFDGATAKIVVNGTVTRTLAGLSGSIPASSGPLKIGSRSDAVVASIPQEPFNGRIDEVKLYGRALADCEVERLAGGSGPCLVSTIPTPPVVTVGAFAFDAPFVISTSSRVLGVTSGDYNNDGFADLASVNLDSNTFSVYLGDGSGGFNLSANVVVAAGPSDISSGDFNNDGNLDLIISSYNANAVVSYLGNGDGTFQHISTVPISINPNFAIPFDFNNDGNLDLISGANNGGWPMYVLQGAGDGTFTIASSFGGGLYQRNPREPAIADFNGDGYVDLLIPETISHVAILFTNDAGAGTFTNAGVKVSGTARLEGAVSGDFNNDGFVDVAISMASLDKVRVMLGDGAGGFSSTTDYATLGTLPNIIRIADMNGDGISDIVAATYFTNGGVSVLLGNGDGTFQAAIAYDTASGANYVTLADFNGDGRLDIATAYSGGVVGIGGVAVLLSTSADISVEATGPLTAVTIGPAIAYDLQDGVLIPTADQSGPFAVGAHTITWSATDTAGNTGTATQNVTVTDTTAPNFTVPTDVTVEATAPLTPVAIGAVPATDLVDGALSAMPDNTGPFPVGTTVVAYSVTDAHGNTATATQNVTVVDTTPPTVTAQLIPVNVDDDEDKDEDEHHGERHAEGLFKVVFSVTDIADANPAVVAMLNGQAVSNGQIVKLERDDEAKAEFEHGQLEIKGMSFTLNVSATDASGNTGSASGAYVFPPGQEHNGDKHHKSKKHDKDD